MTRSTVRALLFTVWWTGSMGALYLVLTAKTSIDAFPVVMLYVCALILCGFVGSWWWLDNEDKWE